MEGEKKPLWSGLELMTFMGLPHSLDPSKNSESC